MRTAAIAMSVLAFVLAWLVSTQLSRGIIDLPRHWWSTLAVAGPAAAAAILWLHAIRTAWQDREGNRDLA